MLPKNQHIKKMVVNVKIVFTGCVKCCWYYLCLPRVSPRSKWLYTLHLAIDLGRKPEEKIRSLMPLAKINQPAVEIRHAVVSSGTSLCLVFFLELHKAPYFSGRVLLSAVRRLLSCIWLCWSSPLEPGQRQTHTGNSAGFSQQMSLDRMRSRWYLPHLPLQMEFLCSHTF